MMESAFIQEHSTGFSVECVGCSTTASVLMSPYGRLNQRTLCLDVAKSTLCIYGLLKFMFRV